MPRRGLTRQEEINKFFQDFNRLINPTLPPSGECKGHNNPNCEPCNNRGAIIFALASISKFIFRKCDVAELKDKRLRGEKIDLILRVAYKDQRVVEKPISLQIQ